MTETCKNPFQNDRHGFRSAVGQVVGRLREHFVLLAPTGRFHDAHTHGLLKGATSGFFDLESQLTLLSSLALWSCGAKAAR